MFKRNTNYKRMNKFYNKYEMNRFSKSIENVIITFIFGFFTAIPLLIFLIQERYLLMAGTFIIFSYALLIEYHYANKQYFEKVKYFREQQRLSYERIKGKKVIKK